jgi:hypothetical protein
MDIAVAIVPTELPRIDVVFRLRQCDIESHGLREGPLLTVAANFRSTGRAFPLQVKSASNKKRITVFCLERTTIASQRERLAGILVNIGSYSGLVRSAVGLC